MFVGNAVFEQRESLRISRRECLVGTVGAEEEDKTGDIADFAPGRSLASLAHQWEIKPLETGFWVGDVPDFDPLGQKPVGIYMKDIFKCFMF